MTDAAARKRAAARIEKIADQHGLSVTVSDPEERRERYALDTCERLGVLLNDLLSVKGAIVWLDLYEDDAERERFKQMRLDLEAMQTRLDLVARGKAA